MNPTVKGVYVFYLLGKPKPSLSSNRENTQADEIQQNLRGTALESIYQPQLNSYGNYYGCNCSKSRCLKLKCSCFGRNGLCGPNCACTNCLNNQINSSIREMALNFNKKLIENAQRAKKPILFKGNKILNAGCNCKRSICETKYCACVKAGAVCSSKCHCEDCFNHKVNLANVDFKVNHTGKNRKKPFKIVIRALDGKTDGGSESTTPES